MTHCHVSFGASGSCLLAALALLSTNLASQEPAGDQRSAQLATLRASAQALAASPIRSGPTSPDGRSAGLWACGSTYKVSFHDGMVFYPYVGAALPHQPFAWRTVSVRAGEQELIDGSRPEPTCSDFRCEYDLGSVTERYDVLDNGLEQSFVVHARPAAGDLVITGEVTTPLSLPTRTARHAGLTLRLADGRPVVDYGHAVVIDGNDVHIPITTETHGNSIVLRVPAEVVANASFPLIIDPLIGTNTLLGFGVLIDEVDVLHETLTPTGLQARTWYAWSSEVAAGDHDIRLWRAGSTFGGTITENYREISTWDSRHGRMTLAPAASMVVLVHGTTVGNNGWILVHRHLTSDNNLRTDAQIVPQAFFTDTDWRPDVGGRLQPNGDKVLITFQRENVQPLANTDTSTVWATIYDASVVPQSAAFVVLPFAVQQRPNADQERPVVNAFASGNSWLCAFQELNNNVPNDDWDITTVEIDASGTVVPTGLETADAANLQVHTIDPEIAGADGRYVLTYTTRDFEQTVPKPSGDRGNTVHAQRIDWDHQNDVGLLPHPEVTLASFGGNVLSNDRIAFDPISDSHWCAAVQQHAQDRYRVHKLGYTGNLVEAATISLATGASPATIAVGFNEELRRYPIVWAENDGVTNVSTIYGTLMEYEAVAPPTTVGFACGSGVWTGLEVTADHQQIGTEDMPLRLTGAPQDLVALLFLSTAQGNLPADPFGAPGCVLVPDILTTAFLGTVSTTITNGDAVVKLDLPEFLSPTPLVLQWAYLVPNVNPLWLQASEGLTFEIAR